MGSQSPPLKARQTPGGEVREQDTDVRAESSLTDGGRHHSDWLSNSLHQNGSENTVAWNDMGQSRWGWNREKCTDISMEGNSG